MAAIQVKTKNNLPVDEKPRVYYAGHPDDFDRCLDAVCNDLFRTQDCAVYYATGPLSQEELETVIGRANLLVIAVTRRLLTTSNRTMDREYPLAVQQGVPVLPLMMEPGLDALYAAPDKFGQRQYLQPGGGDSTAIAYEKKLEQYLQTVLISDEMARCVREEFRGYLFLSYRKKDRQYANELIRRIHQLPECRDMAVWFDEFLTPGESFQQNIHTVLQKSRLFVLLVTPHLLEEPGGTPNYVMGQEYPAARRAGLPLLAAQMVPTDPVALAGKYPGLPPCVAPDEDAFSTQLQQALSSLERDDSPYHVFLMGLAYLHGIDVEIDRQRAVELITQAADDGWPDAMGYLRDIYTDGIYVPADYQKALVWAKPYAQYCVTHLGEDDHTTLAAMNSLALLHSDAGDYQAAAKTMALTCLHYKKVLGINHPETLTVYGNMANMYRHIGMYDKAVQFYQAVYQQSKKTLGDHHPDTLLALHNLATGYSEQGRYAEALTLVQQAYDGRRQLLGEDASDTLQSLILLAACSEEVGDTAKATDLNEQGYRLLQQTLGQTHPQTLAAMENLAMLYNLCGHYDRALPLCEQAYDLHRQVLGNTHPDTLLSLNNLVDVLDNLGAYDRALPLARQVCEQQSRALGEKHPDLLLSLNNLASVYFHKGQTAQAIMTTEKAYHIARQALGNTHPHTLQLLSNLAFTHAARGNKDIARGLYEKCYAGWVQAEGLDHPEAQKMAKILQNKT